MGFSVTFVQSLKLVQANVAGRTKKSVLTSSIFIRCVTEDEAWNSTTNKLQAIALAISSGRSSSSRGRHRGTNLGLPLCLCVFECDEVPVSEPTIRFVLSASEFGTPHWFHGNPLLTQ